MFTLHQGTYANCALCPIINLKFIYKCFNSRTHGESLGNVWDEIYKGIRADNSLIDIVISDLHRFGFVYIDKFHKASMNSVSTSISKQFIAFINES